jgi:hypothetical protein
MKQSMSNKPILPLIFFCTLLSLIGWSGLGLIILYLPPTIGPRWLFFFALFIAISTMFVPVFYLINQRIERDRELSIIPSIRESLELAFYINLLVWLLMGKVFDGVTAFLLLVVLTGIEVLIRMIERSRFNPRKNIGDTEAYEE